MSYLGQPALAVLREFTMTNSEALQNASLLLGGQPALRTTIDTIDEISTTRLLTRGLHKNLGRLRDLLSLTHVHDPDRPEAGFFAVIDPEWAAVEDICLLSDQLSDLLGTLGNQPSQREAPTRAA